MSNANTGDTVKVHYTGRLADGSVFDTSEESEPLEFQLGESTVIAGFEKAVTGMSAGESKTVEVPSADAYGQRREDLVLEVEPSQLPSDMEVEVGTVLGLVQPGGGKVAVRVVEMRENAVVLDANHSLAGVDLTFDITLVEIVNAD